MSWLATDNVANSYANYPISISDFARPLLSIPWSGNIGNSVEHDCVTIFTLSSESEVFFLASTRSQVLRIDNQESVEKGEYL